MRELLEIPDQPDMDDPNSLFTHIDELKSMIYTSESRMNLTDYFNLILNKTKDIYGKNPNL